jgi:HAE1 family hydrophobic/amphiphilic exporter-1
MRTALQGTVATLLRETGEETDIRVRFRQDDRDALDKIMSVALMTPTGRAVTLSQVASVTREYGPLDIRREDKQRKAAVTARLEGRDLGGVTREIDERLKKELVLPDGYRYEFGGAYENMVETLETMGLAFLAAFLLVYMILAAQFESLLQPFIIMLTVPLGIIGVAFGLGVAGLSLSMPAMLGIVILVGIVVNNAIVMVDFINRLRRDGVEFREAIIQAATARLRPILVTSLTTIMGILPMGLSRSQGAEMRAPMGISIASGLTFAMVLTLFVIPATYRLLAGRSTARIV